MKKILFMIKDMNIGGVEKALLNYINEIDMKTNSVTILMLKATGGFIDKLPKEVTIRELGNYYTLPPRAVIKESLGLFLSYIKYKITGNIGYYYDELYKDIQIENEEYDIAIAYQGPMDFITYYVATKINAKSKIQWIHFDIDKFPINYKFLNRILREYTCIYVVSKEGLERFKAKFAAHSYKTKLKESRINTEYIIKESKIHNGFQCDDDSIKLLTVGRLSLEKGQDIGVGVLKRLLDEGYNVKWFFVGEGALRKDLEFLIKNNGLKDKCILLGATTNPYPYIRNCDIYIQPSRQEGYCISLAEAKIFNKEIIATDFTGAREQLENYKNSRVITFEENELYNAIKELLGRSCK